MGRAITDFYKIRDRTVHPLTAFPGATTPQRLYFSDFPLNAPNASSRVLTHRYLKKGSLNKAASSGFLEKYRLSLLDEQ